MIRIRPQLPLLVAAIAALWTLAACGPLTAPGDPAGDGAPTLAQHAGALQGTGSPDQADLTPTHLAINRFWGNSATDVWGVGKGAVTMHWDGTAWRRFANPVTSELRAVWGTAANNVWAVGDDSTILHWNGTAWARSGVGALPAGTGLNDIWGTAANDIWVVGDSGIIVRFDGTSWSLVSIPYYNSFITVWGAAARDLWIGGDLGLLLHWDGSTLNEVATSSAEAIWRIRGTSATSAWMTTDYGTTSKWDGTSWTYSITTGRGEMHVASDATVWILQVGSSSAYYWNGTTWVSKGGYFSNATTMWTLGREGWTSDDAGTLARYNGTTWSRRW